MVGFFSRIAGSKLHNDCHNKHSISYKAREVEVKEWFIFKFSLMVLVFQAGFKSNAQFSVYKDWEKLHLKQTQLCHVHSRFYTVFPQLY